MKKLLLSLILLVTASAQAQVYPMQNGTFSTCSGTFYDSGGAAGDYGSLETYQITFCPPTAGTYVQLTFTDFDLEGFPYDYMTIYSGPNTSGTVIGTFGDTAPGGCDPIASSHPSGCITITFQSDGSFEYGGWAATISCTTTPGGVPIPIPDNAVCSGASPFCADAGTLEFPNIPDGCTTGAPADVTSYTCLMDAPNPAWYFLEIGVAGNINLEIEQTTGPNGTGTGLDVDFVIWGPFANASAACANFTLGSCAGDHNCFGNVVDCSYSMAAVENATILNAQVGQAYMVLITNYDGAPGYITMTQTNSGNANAGSTDCSILCPTAAGTNPTTCSAANGSIRLSGLDPNTNYTITYLDGATPVSVSLTSNAAGQVTITGLDAGSYTNILTNYPGCTANPLSVTLTAAAAPVLNSVTNNTPICTGGNAVFNLSGTPNATITYTVNSGGSQTVALNAAGTATVTINGATVTTTMNISSIATPACTAPLAVSSIVSVNTAASITLTSAAATANQTRCVNVPITNITYAIANGGTGATVTGLPAGLTGTFSGGVFTISGIPTATGTFNYTVTTTGGCSAASATGTVTVNPNATIALTSAAATTNQVLCVSTAINNITYAIADGGTGAAVTGLPAGVTGTFAAGTFTISGTPIAIGTFNYTVTTTGGCGTASLAGTITVNSNATLVLTSVAATANQTVCANVPIANIVYTVGGGATGATVSVLPAGLTGTFSGGTFTIAGTPTATGAFNFAVTTTGGCATASLSGTITINPNATLILTSAAATDNQSLCVNASITNIEYTAANGATGITVLGLPTGVTGSYASGVLTISGTPTASGNFNYTVSTIGGCATVSLAGTIAVNTNSAIALTSAAATANQTLCNNTALANITYTVSGGATGATVTGLPAGVIGAFAAGVFTISGTPTASGLFNYNVTTTGGCTPSALSGTITVNPDATIALTSAIGTDLQGICANIPIANITYSIANATDATVTGLPAGVTGTFAAGNFTISGTPTATGIFNYTVTTTGGCGSDSLSGAISINTNSSIVLTSAAATANQMLCVNTPIDNIDYTVGSGATGATVTGLPAGVTGIFSGGVFTISGTPTVSGTFNYSVATTGGCAPASLTGTIAINPDSTIALTSAIGTDGQTVCINAPIANITYATTNATSVLVLGLPNGVTGSFAAGIFTISGTPIQNGIFNYMVTTTGNCASASLSGTITVNTAATIALASAVGTDNQAVCVNTPITNIAYTVGNGATGAAVIGLPTGVTGTFTGTDFTISGTPIITGTFNYTVTTTGGCASANLSGTITVNSGINMVLTSAAATANQSICINTPIASIVYTTTNATGATATGLPTGVTGNFAAGVFTITGTPTVSGTFNYTVTASGGCGTIALSGTITSDPLVTLALTSAVNTNNQTICITTPIQPIEYTPANGATGATVIGLPPGVTGSFSGGVFTITGTPIIGGAFNYTVTTTGGCGTASLSGTIIINSNAGIVASSGTLIANQNRCQGETLSPIIFTISGGVTDVTVAGLPPGATAVFAANHLTITGTLNVPGSYPYTLTTVGGCGIATATYTISVAPIPTLSLITPAGTDMQSACVNTPIANIGYQLTGAWWSPDIIGLPPGVTGTFAADVMTISGTPSVTGVFNYTVTLSHSCFPLTMSGTITVNPDVTMALTTLPNTANQMFCINTPMQPIVYTIANGTGATVTGLPTGITGTYAAGQFTITGTPTIFGTFTYIVTTTGACGSAAMTGTITVFRDASFAMLTPIGTLNQTICENMPMAPVSFQIVGGTGVMVSGGLPPGLTFTNSGGVYTISGTPTTVGNNHILLTITGINCNPAGETIDITVLPDVSISLTSAPATDNQTVCINNPIADIVYNINVAGVTVTGLPPGVTGSFDFGVFTISGTPSASGTFNYTINATGDCLPSSITGTITVNPNATIALTSNASTVHQIVCINTPIDPIVYALANGATGATVTGLPAGVTANAIAGVLIISGTPTFSGEFNFSITTTGGCLSATTTGSITINPNVVLTLSSAVAITNQILCINTPIQPISYAVTNGGTGTVVTGLPAGVNGNYAAGTLTISGTPTVGGIFNYTVTTTGGCSSDSETGTITVNILATAALNYAASPYCTTLTTPQPIAITGTGSFTGGTFASTAGLVINAATGAITPSLSTAGTYTVTYTIPASGGCPAIPVQTTVTITKAPTAAISYATPFCTSVGAQAVVLTGTSTYLGGTFSAPSGLILNPITGVINPSASMPGNYTVTYTTPASGGCASVIATTTVTINATPTAVATPATQTICSEDTTNINLSSLVGGTTFTWTVVQNNVSGANDGSGNSISQTLETISNAIGTAIYTITPATAFCTGNAITVTITVNPLPRPALAGGVICRNPRTNQVVRTYTLNAGLNNADYDFLWQRNTAPISDATDNTYQADEPGIYTVVATNIHTGCISYPVDAVVSESEVAEVAIISGNDAFVDSPTISVTVVGNGNYEYQLDNGSFQASNVFANLTLGEHTIRVRDQDDCTDIEQTFTVIGYPKFFTPNNDGYNDAWNIFALAGNPGAKISIFDRYGKLVKQISPDGPGWDGSHNGHMLPATDYWFVVEYTDQAAKKEFKAHFSLKR